MRDKVVNAKQTIIDYQRLFLPVYIGRLVEQPQLATPSNAKQRRLVLQRIHRTSSPLLVAPPGPMVAGLGRPPIDSKL
jgi:hypothetical protein